MIRTPADRQAEAARYKQLTEQAQVVQRKPLPDIEEVPRSDHEFLIHIKAARYNYGQQNKI